MRWQRAMYKVCLDTSCVDVYRTKNCHVSIYVRCPLQLLIFNFSWGCYSYHYIIGLDDPTADLTVGKR